MHFEPTRDEKHFWRTTKQFAKEFPPSIELLRGYNELNTPLPFVVFGAVEHYLGGGIGTGRLINLVVSFAIVLLIIIDASRRAPPSTRRCIHIALACLGLLAFPYFLGTSVMLYTDILPVAFVLAGLVLHMRGRPWRAMVMFELAISGRQYAAAFPLALVAFELGRVVWRANGADYPSQFGREFSPVEARTQWCGELAGAGDRCAFVVGMDRVFWRARAARGC